jgi:hypothetical protein
VFLDYQNRLDLRLGKTFKLDRTKIQGFMDVFNVFNAGTALSVNQVYAETGCERPGLGTGDHHGRPVPPQVRPAGEFLEILGF